MELPYTFCQLEQAISTHKTNAHWIFFAFCTILQTVILRPDILAATTMAQSKPLKIHFLHCDAWGEHYLKPFTCICMVFCITLLPHDGLGNYIIEQVFWWKLLACVCMWCLCADDVFWNWDRERDFINGKLIFKLHISFIYTSPPSFSTMHKKKRKEKRNYFWHLICSLHAYKTHPTHHRFPNKCFVGFALSTEMHSGVLDSELRKQNTKVTWAGCKKRNIVCCCDLWMYFLWIQTLPNPFVVISCVSWNWGTNQAGAGYTNVYYCSRYILFSMLLFHAPE